MLRFLRCIFFLGVLCGKNEPLRTQRSAEERGEKQSAPKYMNR